MAFLFCALTDCLQTAVYVFVPCSHQQQTKENPHAAGFVSFGALGAYINQPLIATLGHFDDPHVLGGGISYHHARRNHLAVVINCQRFNLQLERLRVPVLSVLAFGNPPFPALAIA